MQRVVRVRLLAGHRFLVLAALWIGMTGTFLAACVVATMRVELSCTRAACTATTSVASLPLARAQISTADIATVDVGFRTSHGRGGTSTIEALILRDASGRALWAYELPLDRHGAHMAAELRAFLSGNTAEISFVLRDPWLAALPPTALAALVFGVLGTFVLRRLEVFIDGDDLVIRRVGFPWPTRERRLPRASVTDVRVIEDRPRSGPRVDLELDATGGKIALDLMHGRRAALERARDAILVAIARTRTA